MRIESTAKTMRSISAFHYLVAERCCGSARGVSRPLEPLGWPNQGFLFTYMAMPPLRYHPLLYSDLPADDRRPPSSRSAPPGSKVPAWLHEVPITRPVSRPGSLAAAKRRPSCISWGLDPNPRTTVASCEAIRGPYHGSLGPRAACSTTVAPESHYGFGSFFCRGRRPEVSTHWAWQSYEQW
jgi:hypothetical protein